MTILHAGRSALHDAQHVFHNMSFFLSRHFEFRPIQICHCIRWHFRAVAEHWWWALEPEKDCMCWMYWPGLSAWIGRFCTGSVQLEWRVNYACGNMIGWYSVVGIPRTCLMCCMCVRLRFCSSSVLVKAHLPAQTLPNPPPTHVKEEVFTAHPLQISKALRCVYMFPSCVSHWHFNRL